MINIFTDLFEIIFLPILYFLDETIGNYSLDGGGLASYNFKVGFGSVEWFSMDLYALIALIGGLLISIVFIVLIFKVFKFFTKLVNRAFGGRKW